MTMKPDEMQRRILALEVKQSVSEIPKVLIEALTRTIKTLTARVAVLEKNGTKRKAN